MNDSMTQRQRVLLTWLSRSPVTYVDPIRVMKGMFLITMETPKDWLPEDARYEFEPYNWGPFSRDVYVDLEDLQGLGYVSIQSQPGRSWNTYALTESGRQAAESETERLDQQLLEYVDTVSQFVMKKGFSDLLSALYKRYPEYATRSLFVGESAS